MGTSASGFSAFRAVGSRSVVAAGLAIVTLALAGPASAGQDPGIRLGYYAGTLADDPVPVIGVFGRFDIPGPLNLEVSADYRRETLRDGDVEATVIPVRASLVFNFLPVVSPYLLAGIGLDHVGFDFRGAPGGVRFESGVVLEAHAGLGLEVGLGPLSVIGDLRYCSVGGVSGDGVQAALGRDYDASGWYASLSAGISF